MDNGTIEIPGYRVKKYPGYSTAELEAVLANPPEGANIAAIADEIEARKTDKPRPRLYV